MTDFEMSGGALALLLAAMAVPTFATANRDDTAEELLVRAASAMSARQFADAERLAAQAAEKKPAHAPAHVQLAQAQAAQGKFKVSLTALNRALELDPAATTYLIRGQVHSALDLHTESIADFNQALTRDNKLTTVYHFRGREQFKAGKIDASIADFDRYIELVPDHALSCWERGLSRYYAGRFKEAQSSFEDYHKVGPGDIENGLWRMISQAEVEGLQAAQKALLQYDPKTRPPFPLLYDLYAGQSPVDNVLKNFAAGAADDADRTTRTFYAHLYVGLWFIANRDSANALSHMQKAVALRSSDYMWYVAREHLRRLESVAATRK